MVQVELIGLALRLQIKIRASRRAMVSSPSSENKNYTAPSSDILG